MKSANIHDVLRSFPEFESAYTALKSEVRDLYNWAIDGLAHMPDGLELYDDNEALIATPLNDDFLLVAATAGDDYGYKIIAWSVLDSEHIRVF